jgi:hypothetical protein
LTKVDLGFCQNGTSHALLGQAVRAAAATPTRLGHPRFLDALRAQTADFNEVRSPKMPAILGIMWLNFLSVVRRTGETVSFDAGRVALTLLEKSGQRARLEIRSAPDVLIELPTRTSPAQQAQGGISRRVG